MPGNKAKLRQRWHLHSGTFIHAVTPRLERFPGRAFNARAARRGCGRSGGLAPRPAPRGSVGGIKAVVDGTAVLRPPTPPPPPPPPPPPATPPPPPQRPQGGQRLPPGAPPLTP